MAVNLIRSYAYHLFGGYFKRRRSRYFNLRQELLKTRMSVGYEMYLSTSMAYSIMMAVIGLVIAFLIVSIFGAPDITFSRSILTDLVSGFHQYRNMFFKTVSIIGITVLFSSCTYLAFYNAPKVINGDRKRRIDLMLPYAVHYMSAMSGAGVIPVDMFSSLAKNKIYGEAAVEISYIVRNVIVLGHDLVTAMKNIAATTPSYRLQEFLQGAITIISSGGDIESYFKIKAEQFVVENRREQKEFLETLGLLAETYVTAFVAGPLFLIVMMSVMAIMGGINMLWIYMLVYLAIPFGSLIFLILISSMTPEV